MVKAYRRLLISRVLITKKILYCIPLRELIFAGTNLPGRKKNLKKNFAGINFGKNFILQVLIFAVLPKNHEESEN